MKRKNNIISHAIEEVWEWKDNVYQDIKDKNFKEKKEYFNSGLRDAVKIINGKLVKNPDGSYSIIV